MSLGGAIMVTLGSLHMGPIQFDRPVWLLLLPVVWVAAVVIALVNLSGLGRVTRWTALAIRLLVLLLLVSALSEPQWRKVAKNVAVTVVVDSSQSVPADLQKRVDQYIVASAGTNDNERNLLGLVTTAKDALVEALPSRLTRGLERQASGNLTATDLSAGLRMALAIAPTDAAYRIVLASDGNQNVGNVLATAEAARALGVPVDVLPLKYTYESEVLVDRVVAPASAREGEPLTVRVVLNASKDVRGRLSILMNGEAVDVNGAEAGTAQAIELHAGTNVKTVQVPALVHGPMKFEAIFEPETSGGRAVGDAIAENNRGSGVTFVGGGARVLLLAEKPENARPLIDAMKESKIAAEVRGAAEAPSDLTELNAYDAIVLANEAASAFSLKQQEELKRYVHDGGGGLVMVGGDESFGAGGWIGSPLEDALPVKLDPPQKRQMPKGALVIITHSIEMPEGVYWGKQTATAAVNALSRLDLYGLLEFDGFRGMGATWRHDLQEVGDGTKAKRAIQNLAFGDMPDYTPPVQAAYDALVKCDAGQRHLMIISDGDASTPPPSLLDKFKAAKITISTVEVFPHSSEDMGRLRWMAQYTGGRHYFVNTSAALATIPQIFIKEAQTVRRSLIQEFPDGFTPTLVPGLSEALRGVTRVPPIRGYVVTAEREGLALTVMKGKEGDPILAQWQHGLGRVVAYTSDAATRWNPDWVAWAGYKAFWEQQVRWAMRPTGSANIRASTENRGEATVITVDAVDSKGERLNFARFKGRVAGPDGAGVDVDLKQVGPGRYQGVVPTAAAGSYVASLRYVAPDPEVQSGRIEGSVQLAINRPFADEYRTLQDNVGLLEQLAAATGGRVLSGDPEKDKLWDKQGLRFPVALTSIWLAMTLVGLGVFLMDVGVRRVRIDVPAIRRWVVGLFRRGASASGQQIESLKSAREAAKRKIAARELSQAERDAERAASKAATATAKVKFEAAPEHLKKPAAAVALGGPDATPETIKPKPRPSDAPKDQGESMSRLMEAKKKAREEMQE